MSTIASRAQSCLLGHLAGDSLGGRYEFSVDPAVRPVLEDGGFWNLAAGQPTDDGEMMITLARALIAEGAFHELAVWYAYRRWLDSAPFDVGMATNRALATGKANPKKIESNGALMRVAPIGVAYWRRPAAAEEAGQADAALTHASPKVQRLSGLYARAIAVGVASGDRLEMSSVLGQGRPRPVKDFIKNMGWVEIAYGNAANMLLHYGDDLMSAVIRTVARGGDTDTNAAIAAALVGAGGGIVPSQWVQAIRGCDSSRGAHPRPEAYAPNKIEEIAQKLLDLNP